MTERSTSADPGVEALVARPGGISYLGLPARDIRASAEFYRDVLGGQLRGDPGSPSFADGTGFPTATPPLTTATEPSACVHRGNKPFKTRSSLGG